MPNRGNDPVHLVRTKAAQLAATPKDLDGVNKLNLVALGNAIFLQAALAGFEQGAPALFRALFDLLRVK